MDLRHRASRRGTHLCLRRDRSDAPIFKWRKSAADLPNLGQTWSTPFIFKLDGDTDPTLVMGAGYDTGEDSSPAVANGSTGRGIYVLNANDGSVKNGGDVVAGFMNTARTRTSPIPCLRTCRCS
jgi:Tfp pilus tip-associated adhesin PilY1